MRAGYRILGAMCLTLLFSPMVYSTSIDSLLSEAKMKADKGDHEGAAVAYKEVLDLDKNHQEARNGLASVLMHAQSSDQHADQTDALTSVLDHEGAGRPALRAE